MRCKDARSFVHCLQILNQVRTLPTTHTQLDVTFPKMPCSWLSLDTMDVSGDLHLDVVRLVCGFESLSTN